MVRRLVPDVGLLLLSIQNSFGIQSLDYNQNGLVLPKGQSGLGTIQAGCRRVKNVQKRLKRYNVETREPQTKTGGRVPEQSADIRYLHELKTSADFSPLKPF